MYQGFQDNSTSAVFDSDCIYLKKLIIAYTPRAIDAGKMMNSRLASPKSLIVAINI